MRPGRVDPDVGPVAVHAGPGRRSLRQPGIRSVVVCRARHRLVGPGRRGRGRRPDQGRGRTGRHDRCRWFPPRLGTPPDGVPRRRWHARLMGPHRLGPARRPRRPDADPEGVRRGLRGTAGDVRPGPRRSRRGAFPAHPVHVDGPPAGARSDGPRQQRGLRRLARRGGPRRRRGGRNPGCPAPRAARLRPRG